MLNAHASNFRLPTGTGFASMEIHLAERQETKNEKELFPFSLAEPTKDRKGRKGLG